MNSIMKIIFIKEEQSLVWEMSPYIEGLHFMNGLLFNLTLDCSNNEQPIKILKNGKRRVIDYLKRNYSSEKKINRLIKFFNDISDNGKSIYIYPFNSQIEEFYDICKKSLEYYNQGLSNEEIIALMDKYIKTMQECKKFLDILPYNWNAILPNKKITIGKINKKERHCIYCHGFIGDGNTTFREDAHAIPEALGNTKLFQNEECDICNDYFAQNAEEDFSNMFVWKRLQYGLKGKKGYPTFQFGPSTYAKYFDAKTVDYNKNWGRFEAIKPKIKETQRSGPVIISSERRDICNSIDITYIKDYLPMHVYKTLVKCVIGLIGNDKLTPFSDTIQWLRYTEENRKLPKVALIAGKRLVMEPELYIFTRKNDSDITIPFCFGELRVLDEIYTFIVPYCKKDKNTFLSEYEYKPFKNLLNILYEKYELLDFSDISPMEIKQHFDKVKSII